MYLTFFTLQLFNSASMKATVSVPTTEETRSLLDHDPHAGALVPLQPPPAPNTVQDTLAPIMF